jgi:hypothetical protein
LQERTDHPEALNELAWVLWTNPDGSLRDGAEVVRLAERASQLTKREMPSVLLTLGAAYAEAGRFSDAVACAQLAEKLAIETNRKSVAQRAAQLLDRFRASQPFRE